MKKSNLLLAALAVVTFDTSAQSDPYFLTDGFSPFWNNPAATGSFNKFSVTTTLRNQWPSIAGNFQTLGFNVEADARFGSKNSNTAVILPIGVNAISDQFGPFNMQVINVPISVPLEFKNSTLAIGVSVGIKRVELDWNPFKLGNQIPQESGSALDLNAGLFWSSKNYYLGLSITNVTAPVIVNTEFTRQYNFQAGYRFKVGKHHIFPMVSGTSASNYHLIRAMSYFQFKDDVFSIAAGLSRRDSYIIGGTARLKQFKLAYLYNITTSSLSNASAGSHEFRLSYAIAKRE